MENFKPRSFDHPGQYYTFCCSLQENTQSFATNNEKVHSYVIAKNPEHFRINQIQLQYLHLNQHSITLLGINMHHSAYKRKKYTFINANIQVQVT